MHREARTTLDASSSITVFTCNFAVHVDRPQGQLGEPKGAVPIQGRNG